MTREDIIRIAEECGIPEFENNESQANNIMRFATLVASAEREACAEVCDDLWEDDGTAYACAEAIRARGNVATNDTSQERVDETIKQRHDTPKQRTWVGLTDAEYEQIHLQMNPMYFYKDFARAIEAKLKEKNT